MLKRKFLALAAVLTLIAATSCAGGVAALLLYTILDDEAPTRTWTGTVIDQNSDPVGGILVQVRAEIANDDDLMHFSDTTNLNGEYTVKFRWHEDVNYSIRVIDDGTVYAEETIGKVPEQDRELDFSITL